jgi:hypothetical protein
MRATIKSHLGLACVPAGLVLAGVHGYVRSRGPDYAGFLSALDHLFDLALVAAVMAVCASIGKTALARHEKLFDQALEYLLFSVAVGAGIVATTILFLGLLGGLRPSWLLLLFVGHVIVARRQIPGLFSSAARACREIRDNASAFDIWVFSLVILFMLSQALLPPLDWDSLLYHLEIPRQYLQKGRIYLPADNLRTAFVQLEHMLYLPLLACGSISGPAVLNTFFAAGLGLAAFSFGRRFLDAFHAGKGLSLLWGSPVLIAVAVTAKVDVTVAFYLFLAQHALLRVELEEGARQLLVLAAVLLGLAVGVKLTAAIYGLALTPWILRACCKQRRAGPAAVKAILVFGLAAFIAYLPWLLKNLLVTPFPFYPYSYPHGTKDFMEPCLAGCYGAEHKLPAYNIHDDITALFVTTSGNPLHLFWAPERLWSVGVDNLWVLNLFCLLLPLWALCLDVSVLNWLIIPALLFLTFFMYVFRHPDMRYLTPIMAPLTMASIGAAERFLARFFSRPALHRLFTFCTVLVLLPALGLMQERLRDTATFSYLSGRISSQGCLLADRLDHGNNHRLMQVSSYINRHVPKQSRILMLFEARGFYFEVPVLRDTRSTNWLLLSQLASPLGCLRSLGITHVLVNLGALRYYAERGLDPRSRYLRGKELGRFIARELVLESYGPGFNLYRLRDQPAPRGA